MKKMAYRSGALYILGYYLETMLGMKNHLHIKLLNTCFA